MFERTKVLPAPAIVEKVATERAQCSPFLDAPHHPTPLAPYGSDLREAEALASRASSLLPRSRRGGSKESLWTICWSESAYLVWKLRCERVIQNDGKEFTVQEVVGRWKALMNRRFTTDRRTAGMRMGQKHASPEMVYDIWRPILEEKDLPAGWITNNEVLVGIGVG